MRRYWHYDQPKDVYKRQSPHQGLGTDPHQTASGHAPAFHPGNDPRGRAVGCAPPIPVSYTHLDVYKRQHWYWPAHATLSAIQAALLQRARGQYRRDGRLLTGTKDYQALMQNVRAIWKELNDAG